MDLVRIGALIGRKTMREIKFRAWLKEEKIMIDVSE